MKKYYVCTIIIKKVFMKRGYLIMALVCMLFVSCGNEPEMATAEVKNITNITATSATIICDVVDDGGSEVTAKGICWSINQNPTLESGKGVYGGKDLGYYECEMTDLDPNTTYYVRTYAKNSVGMAYGEEKNFTTLDSNNGGDEFAQDGNVNGYAYVDLGLPSGLKWATYNIGAISPKEYGDYYAWGEVNTKAEYSFENSLTMGQEINDISGNPQYDAATVNWGEAWRIPTKTELEELLNVCKWEWTSIEGTYGYKVKGLNGKYIFLPSAGYQDQGGQGVGNHGFYMSSTPGENLNYNCYVMNFASDQILQLQVGNRHWGMSIRPVTDK